MEYNETIYGNSYLLGKDVYIDGKHRIKNIAFDNYLKDLGLLDHTDIVHNLSVVWYVEDDEQYVQQIYNHDTGEIYFDEPTDEWTDEVDEIVSALLMYGNLEQQIGVN
jgi:hypothetical protein|tara:strand:- start:1360 stop:1683 length:324 start_codon:yes stop_codon:yes gene_type:complete